ncbi:tail fiber domain-containing protein [Spartinivicinus poritis]|uniref:Tail fiber domain-containing protein n=1 Tax=Spartinivicinus poritis TaxID=2994640 RepID=A0ABT5UBK8_9GAMM|nr:tail fiber domain-containing protein [Spartinivicinus sp. A2-2]MDE1463712.1 tail fiber domain-containing protein [Spartinivicinus sp. A2-2]
MNKIIAVIVLTSVSAFSHGYAHESCKHLTGSAYSKCRSTPNFIRLSDQNLKKNTAQLEKALENISKLNGVSYEWKKNSKKDIGVIAQDVETVFPELVQNIKITNEDGTEKTLKQVNYAGLVGVLIEAVKELKHENQALKDLLGI